MERKDDERQRRRGAALPCKTVRAISFVLEAMLGPDSGRASGNITDEYEYYQVVRVSLIFLRLGGPSRQGADYG